MMKGITKKKKVRVAINILQDLVCFDDEVLYYYSKITSPIEGERRNLLPIELNGMVQE